MKKLILALLCLISGSHIYAKEPSAAEQLVKFNTMEANHKKDWLRYTKDNKVSKESLLEQEINDCTKFKNKHILDFQKNCDCSPKIKEQKMNKKLRELIDLHKKCVTSWKDYENKRHDKVNKIAAKHNDEFAKFEKSLKLEESSIEEK